MKPFLTVDNEITIHLPRLELVDEVFELIDSQRSYLGQWFPWVEEIKSPENVSDVIREAARENQKGRKLKTYIGYKGEIVGSISLVSIDKENRIAELGYWLSEDQQGKGIMTKTCKRFIEYIFRSKASINRIEIKVMSINNKSIQVAERLGFYHEGTLREAVYFKRRHFDFEMYSFLRKDWIGLKENTI